LVPLSRGGIAAMSDWTAEETRELIRLWSTTSAAQIAKHLQRPRDAVSAKAARLRDEGVPLPRAGRKHFAQNPWPVRAKPETIAARKPAVIATQCGADSPVPPLAMRPCSLIELDKSRCRWPLGDIVEVAVQYCGGVVVPGSPYCAHHWRRASKGSAS
jgi:GcrA cell cycle regulator